MAIFMMRESPEYITYKINVNSNGDLQVPISGKNFSGSYDATYNWKISVDGGEATVYSGTGSMRGRINISGYTAGTNHLITITPVSEDYGWARAYGWFGTGNLITEVIYDGSYKGFAESATSTGDYFRALEYYGCSNLTKVPDEVLPNTVTSIGTNFRLEQYYGCTNITKAPIEVLPDSVTSIGTNFRSEQYNDCRAISEISGWKDLSIGNNYYRYNQFANCNTSKTVKVLSNVGYASYSSYSLSNAYVTTVQVPSAYLSNFTGASVQPRSSITDSKFVGY